jgi:hypothetical protein
MPKWTEYTSKNTLADNDEVMLYDATARANKRGLMSEFWDYVVDKMATAVISKLETNNKTIIGAINALNSDSKLIYFVGSEDFGSKIASSGLLSGVRVKFFICNNATNNPIGSGYIILMHAPNFWKNHPNYICVYNSNIKCGTIDCTDITNLKIIQ